MNSETDKHLELVILAQSAARRLDLGDELGVHPPQLRRPRHSGAGPLGGTGRAVCCTSTAPASELRLIEVIDNFQEEVPDVEIAAKQPGGLVAVAEHLDEAVHQAEVPAHQLRPGDPLLEALVVVLDDPILLMASLSIVWISMSSGMGPVDLMLSAGQEMAGGPVHSLISSWVSW